jgi:hypothetical protein
MSGCHCGFPLLDYSQPKHWLGRVLLTPELTCADDADKSGNSHGTLSKVLVQFRGGHARLARDFTGGTAVPLFKLNQYPIES